MGTAEKTIKPMVTVCLPNLNNRSFLEERLQTIFDQTFCNWELIVVDNYSDDGAWELFQKYAKKEPRMRISQAPKGTSMYCNWNNCLRKASGKYIYIATSDDTMSPDCLEKMVNALEQNPDCDICHCCLEVIDGKGNRTNKINWENISAQKFYGNLTFKRHIRKAPLDGILHFALGMMYVSITQLLIRKRLFDKVGLFRSDWGPAGDFEWEMRASLVGNTIHIPEYLATWRQHDAQASGKLSKADSRVIFVEMISEAVQILKKYDEKLYTRLICDMQKLLSIYNEEKIIYTHMGSISYSNMRDIISCLKKIISHPIIVSRRLGYCLFYGGLDGRRVKFMRNYISSLGLDKNIIEV